MIELIKAMIKFNQEVGYIKETCKGQTGNRTFSYADLEDIAEATMIPLCNNGLWVRQYLQQHEDGTHMHTDIYHISGDMLPSNCLIDYEAKDIKDHGGNISYFRRYTQLAVLGLVASDKQEKTNVEDKPQGTFTKKEHKPEVKTVSLPLKKIIAQIEVEKVKLPEDLKLAFENRVKRISGDLDHATETQLKTFLSGVKTMVDNYLAQEEPQTKIA